MAAHQSTSLRTGACHQQFVVSFDDHPQEGEMKTEGPHDSAVWTLPLPAKAG